MSGTKHVALWSLMFQFCHMLDLQNGIHETRSSGQGVWVPVISYLKQQICIFSGGHAGFSVSSFPPLPTPYPLLLHPPHVANRSSKIEICCKKWQIHYEKLPIHLTWKTANPLYILTKTKKSNTWRSHTYSRQILYQMTPMSACHSLDNLRATIFNVLCYTTEAKIPKFILN